MSAFIVRSAINAAALVIAALVVQWASTEGYVEGTIVLRGAEAVLLTALIFGLVNALIRPVVLLFTCLINMLTLGLFTLVVNALMLWLTSWLVEQTNARWDSAIAFSVDGIAPALLGALIMSVASAILTRVTR